MLNMNAVRALQSGLRAQPPPRPPKRPSSPSRRAGMAIQAMQATDTTDTADLWRLAFRGDTRSYEEIFETGFQPRYAGGINVTKGAQMTGGVSTSNNMNVAMGYAGAYGGYVYAVCLPDNSVHVLSEVSKKGGTMGAKMNAFSQQERAAPRIPANNVIACRECRVDPQNNQRYEMTGAVINNPLCTAPKAIRRLGVQYLSMDVTVAVPH